MKLKTSFCNPPLLKKNIGRFAVIWGFFTFTLFMNYPLILLSTRSDYATSADWLQFIRSLLTETGIIFGLFVNQFYAIICATACFGYLHKTRSAYMMHAFPLTRDGLFSTNLISGLLFGLVPYAFIGLLNLLITGSVHGAAPIVLSTLAFWVLEYLFFYGLAVLCMVLTGKTVFGLLCYFALNYVFVLLELVLRILAEPLLFGIADFDLDGLITEPLCPTVKLIDLAVNESSFPPSGRFLGYLGAVAGAGIVLMLLAWVLYRIRHMENAGEVIAYPKLRPIFRYFFTVCVSLGLGLILAAICDFDALSEGNGFGLLICLLIAGLIGYFAAEMMLRRTLRVFRKKAFAGFGIFAAVVIALFCTVQFDVFGIVHRVPEPETVKYAELSTDGALYVAGDIRVRFEDLDDIEKITEMHQSILEHHDSGTAGDWVNLTLTYRLKNGLSMKRTYCCEYGISDAEMTRLMNRPEIMDTYYDLEKLENATGADIMYTPYWSEHGYLNAQQMQKLAACLQEDLDAGCIDFYHAVFEGGEDSFILELSDKSTVQIPISATNAYALLQEYCPEIIDEEIYDQDGRYESSAYEEGDTAEPTEGQVG